jgi:hypothetical protein
MCSGCSLPGLTNPLPPSVVVESTVGALVVSVVAAGVVAAGVVDEPPQAVNVAIAKIAITFFIVCFLFIIEYTT